MNRHDAQHAWKEQETQEYSYMTPSPLSSHILGCSLCSHTLVRRYISFEINRQTLNEQIINFLTYMCNTEVTIHNHTVIHVSRPYSCLQLLRCCLCEVHTTNTYHVRLLVYLQK